MQGRGRRLRDGEEVAAPKNRTSSVATLAGIACLVAMACWCPTHDSFEAYLAQQTAHPSGWLSTSLQSLTSLAERVRIAVAAETRSYVIFRVGSFRGRHFLGACGTWLSLPSLPGGALRLPSLSSISICDAEAMAPHELVALLFVVGFVLQQIAPRTCYRHAYCSLNALRAGRLWTALTANCAHAHPAHLIHNLLQVLHLGPIVASALGCERSLLLLLATALASSLASVAWFGVLGGNGGAGSIGGSGVAMGLVAANAALFPRVDVSMYGVQLTAAQLPIAYLLLDAISASGRQGQVDVSAHAGGALAGWMLAKRWRPWWLLS